MPDLACFGKGISSSLPLAAVAGRADVMDLHPAGSMTFDAYGQSGLLRGGAGFDRLGGEGESGRKRRRMGAILQDELHRLQGAFPRRSGVEGKGLVAGVACVQPGGKEAGRRSRVGCGGACRSKRAC